MPSWRNFIGKKKRYTLHQICKFRQITYFTIESPQRDEIHNRGSWTFALGTKFYFPSLFANKKAAERRGNRLSQIRLGEEIGSPIQRFHFSLFANKGESFVSRYKFFIKIPKNNIMREDLVQRPDLDSLRISLLRNFPIISKKRLNVRYEF